jgi:serpin B
MPYDGNELSMIAITAAEPNLADLQSDLNWQVVEDLTSRIEYRQVNLSMPKFEFESEYGLKETLMMLGMQQAFTDQADLSGMSGIKDLVINDVVHKAFISVDEAGTEAAAATGVIVGTVSIPVAPVEVNLDSPFFFMIKDKATGAILFAGRLANPGS